MHSLKVNWKYIEEISVNCRLFQTLSYIICSHWKLEYWYESIPAPSSAFSLFHIWMNCDPSSIEFNRFQTEIEKCWMFWYEYFARDVIEILMTCVNNFISFGIRYTVVHPSVAQSYKIFNWNHPLDVIQKIFCTLDKTNEMNLYHANGPEWKWPFLNLLGKSWTWIECTMKAEHRKTDF